MSSRRYSEPAPEHGLGLLERTGLLGVFLPELTAARGCSQKGMHAFDVMDHLFLAVKAAQPDLVLRLAALFHDVGKPPTRALGEDGLPIFYNHEKVSASLAEKALKRLKFPNEVISRVLHLVVNHMFDYGEDWTDAAVRRFIARVGKENIEDLFSLRSADTAATQGLPPDPRLLEPFRSRIALILRGENAFSLKDLKIGVKSWRHWRPQRAGDGKDVERVAGNRARRSRSKQSRGASRYRRGPEAALWPQIERTSLSASLLQSRYDRQPLGGDIAFLFYCVIDELRSGLFRFLLGLSRKWSIFFLFQSAGYPEKPVVFGAFASLQPIGRQRPQVLLGILLDDRLEILALARYGHVDRRPHQLGHETIGRFVALVQEQCPNQGFEGIGQKSFLRSPSGQLFPAA